MSWSELQAFINQLPPTGESALYRSLHPKSWWWTPEIDFIAPLLHSAQVANWQRGGGKGARPKLVKRPKDPSLKQRSAPKTGAELLARKRATLEELKRRQQGGD